MTFRAAILVCSDRVYRGERSDSSGSALRQRLVDAGWKVADPEVRPDELNAITDWLKRKVASGKQDLILTCGGTGVAPRDVTPEATLQIIARRVPGLEEAMRAASRQITPHGMLSRGVAGVVGRILIVNLPGNPQGAVENLEVILLALPHAIALLRGEHPDF